MDKQLEQRIKELGIVCRETKEILGWNHTYSRPVSGDGHSSRDAFEEVTERESIIAVHTHPIRERIKARRELRKLYKNPDTRLSAGTALGYDFYRINAYENRIKAYKKFKEHPVKETAIVAGQVAASAVLVGAVLAGGYYIIHKIGGFIISR